MYSNLFTNIKQKGAESIIMAVVIAEETASRQVNSHLVPSIQLQDCSNSGAVFLIIFTLIAGCDNGLAVNLQTGTGSQVVTRRTSVTVNSEGEAVDTRVGNSEDTGVHTVATTQVKEDMLVDDVAVDTEGAIALKMIITE